MKSEANKTKALFCVLLSHVYLLPLISPDLARTMCLDCRLLTMLKLIMMQETLQSLDDQRVGLRTPHLPSRKSTLSRASTQSGVLPDARANEDPDLLSTGDIDVEALADEYESHAKNASEGEHGYAPSPEILPAMTTL